LASQTNAWKEDSKDYESLFDLQGTRRTKVIQNHIPEQDAISSAC